MNTHNTLYPPQTRQLSDNAIGKVIPRSSSQRYDQAAATRTSYSSCKQSNQLIPPGTSRPTAYTVPLHENPAPETLRPNRDHSRTTNFETQWAVHRARRRVSSLRDKIPSHKITTEVIEAFIQDRDRLRELRRKQQQRYRKRCDERTSLLESDVRKLQEAVRQLELIRQLLPSHMLPTPTPWNIVAEYYRLFRHDSKIPVPTNKSNPPSISPATQVQTNFLRSMMSPEVSFNSGFGLKALQGEWRSVPLLRKGITVQLLRLEYDGKGAMIATIQSCSTITEVMVRRGFSHLVDNQDHLDPLATRLLGRRLIIPTTARFEWDVTARLVVSMHHTSDFVTPFLKLLGNLEDVNRALDGSFLSRATGMRS